MATPVTLRVQQQGYLRAAGYQATQWSVTEPIAVPPGSPPVATDPSSFDALFVVDTTGPIELLRRVAKLTDFVALQRSDLRLFEPKGIVGASLLSLAVAGDTLLVQSAPSYWFQTQAPYTTTEFLVDTVLTRASGSAPALAAGRQLTLPGYTFSDDDIGRWVLLSGFTTGGYNGYTQIVSYVGNVATINKTVVDPETGGAWAFRILRINPNVGSGLEPKYFPTRETNLGWSLHRGSPSIVSPLADDTSGGVTVRTTPGALVRTVRFTALCSTLEDATALFGYVRASLAALQDAASVSSEDFTTLVTITEGP